MTQPEMLSATEAAAAIRAGTLSSEELVRACLDRIDERDDVVGAWEHLDADLALRYARERDAEPPRGPLHGVPVGVKDLIDTADQPTGYGSSVYVGHRPRADAACVALLRGAGAVVLGKTVTTEFALFTPGRTANPLDPRRTPGGSSSGSAAAVADGMVSVALGTQTAASVVRPASFCGVWGLKPTYGAYPLEGVRAVSPALDTLGTFARSAEDLALLHGVLAGSGAPGRSPASSGPPRIGLVRTAQWEGADRSTRDRIEQAAARLAGSTAVEEVDLPAEFADLPEAQDLLMVGEAAAALAAERQQHADQLSARLTELLDRGARLPAADVEACRELAAHCRGILPDVLAGVDVLLAPSVVGEAPLGLDATGDPLFCRMWTLLGTPTVAVPGLHGPAGLPLGIQLVGSPGEDEALIGAAAWVAEALT